MCSVAKGCPESMSGAATVEDPARILEAGALRVRPARAEDVPAIFENIGAWAQAGRKLVRPMQNIFENLRDLLLCEVMAVEGPPFAGHAALHILWRDIGGVR